MEEEDEHDPEKKNSEEEPPPRCGRHPSQLLTGICSSCLMERLSSVRDQPEIVEVAGEGPSADTGKLRKTLMLLFQLDDSAHPSEGSADAQVAETGPGSGGGRRRSGSWLRSILPARGLRWRKSGGPSSVKPPSSSCDGRGADGQVDRKLSFRRSSDWRVARQPTTKQSSLDPPRHSWDGAMVGRAFACSFACLEDPPDTTGRATRSNADEMVAETRNGGRHSVEMPATNVGVGRRRSNRWSRVWDRSITSPLKEFVRKGEHVLERSLSESRREVRRGKNAEAADIGRGEFQTGRSANNGHVSGRASQGATRSSQTASTGGDAPNFRADWLKNKECKIGRSRSVHYTSPGNLDNGMLRFYLTPMRSTRTANRGRRRNPRLLGRGLFGFI